MGPQGWGVRRFAALPNQRVRDVIVPPRPGWSTCGVEREIGHRHLSRNRLRLCRFRAKVSDTHLGRTQLNFGGSSARFGRSWPTRVEPIGQSWWNSAHICQMRTGSAKFGRVGSHPGNSRGPSSGMMWVGTVACSAFLARVLTRGASARGSEPILWIVPRTVDIMVEASTRTHKVCRLPSLGSWRRRPWRARLWQREGYAKVELVAGQLLTTRPSKCPSASLASSEVVKQMSKGRSGSRDAAQIRRWPIWAIFWPYHGSTNACRRWREIWATPRNFGRSWLHRQIWPKLGEHGPTRTELCQKLASDRPDFVEVGQPLDSV